MYTSTISELGQLPPPGGYAPGGGSWYPTGGGGPFTGAPSAQFQLPGLPGIDLDLGDLADWLTMGTAVLSKYRDLVSTVQGVPWSSNYDNDPMSTCPGTPDFDAVARAVRSMPQAGIDWIVGTLREGNQGNGPRSRSELQNEPTLPFWVKAMMGGDDCRVTNPNLSPFLQEEFAALIATYSAPAGSPGFPDPSTAGPGMVGKSAMLLVGAGLIFALVRARG